ncbi:glutamate--tRNA ligase [Candidatus Beckwithbacteria bacterium]|nr:glutamate--tRNA ligase [Candidatus Beckwithbacteria bacterium]
MVHTRFAPSPTGFVHIGSIYSVLLDFAVARKNHGKFTIRIEDTDRNRYVADAEAKLYEAIDWFGLQEDESSRKGGKFAPYHQSERLAVYQEYVQKLITSGNAYYCFCTTERLDQMRKDQQKSGKPPMYDKHCRNLSAEEVKANLDKKIPYVIRLKVPENIDIEVNDLIRGKIFFPSKDVDDQVLLKSDGFPTYHLAAIVDDHLMEITHIIRGEEWLPSSPKHVLLYQMFGWQMPVLFHTPTLRNPDKTKLSKRKGHTNVGWYQDQGFLPEAILNFIGQLGWTHPEGKEIFSLEEFVQLFKLEDVSPAGPVFDETKLRWMNGKYIREILSEDELFERIKKYLTLAISDQQLKKVIPLIKERLEVLSQVNDLLQFLLPEQQIDVELVKKQSKKTEEEIKKLLIDLQEALQTDEEWTVQSIELDIRNLKASYPDWGGRNYFMTIRVVTTAFPVTPPLFESIEVLGKELVLKRVESVINKL